MTGLCMYLKTMCIAAIYDRTVITAIYDRTVYVSKNYVYCSDL